MIGKRIVRTEVEFRPAKVIVKQIVQQIAKCADCGEKGSLNEKSHFRKAAIPASPLAHSIATPSLVAQIMYQKFAMGLPLSRQEKDWFRLGLVLSRSNMANWVIRCSQYWLEPIYWRIHEKLLDGYKGCLITDAYAGYDKVPDVKRALCWSHARRYLIDSIPLDAKAWFQRS